MVRLSLLLRRTTVLDAAVRMHGLKPAVAQVRDSVPMCPTILW